MCSSSEDADESESVADEEEDEVEDDDDEDDEDPEDCVEDLDGLSDFTVGCRDSILLLVKAVEKSEIYLNLRVNITQYY